MTSKKWMLLFVLTVLALPVLLAGLNFFVDPFGIFGNLEWYSYSETLNPRVAKTAYLEEHHQEYDSYIIGCSSTSSLPVDALNEALDARFYNLIMYGADLKDVEETARYLLEHYTVENLVVNVYVDNALYYNDGQDSLTSKLHEKVSGENPLSFYGGYLLANPNYAFDKLSSMAQDTWLTQPFDVFNEETGCYDKKVRDVEPIGDLDRYYESYPIFLNYPERQLTVSQTENCVESLTVIRDLCQEYGVDLYVTAGPVYSDYLDYFSTEQLVDFYSALAEVTPLWDFAYSSVSEEPRYFYDETHFRNAVGEMMVTRMFGGDGYCPEDFGELLTGETARESLTERFSSRQPAEEENYTWPLTILTYHHLSEDGEGDVNISVARFEEQLAALQEAGYQSVTLEQVYAYVEQGEPLPEKALLITFDDGYESNYTLAWPLLEKYGMKATIFVIGVSVGKDTYKDTDNAMTPHFSYEQAQEMIDSGTISIQSHTYDMHQWEPFEEGTFREGILPLEGESEQEYIQAFTQDLTRSRTEIQENTTETVTALAYPGGRSTQLAQVLCGQLGLKATMTTEPRVNTLVKGLPQCLYGLGRFSVDDISGEALLELIQP